MGGYIGKGQPVAAGGNSVETADILDDAVTNAKIATNAVTGDSIASNAVGNSELSDDAVGVAELSATGTASSSTFLRGDNAWVAVDALPSQSGNSGKFLTTDATNASWATISTVFPFYKADGNADNITITNGEFPFYKANGSQDNIGVS